MGVEESRTIGAASEAEVAGAALAPAEAALVAGGLPWSDPPPMGPCDAGSKPVLGLRGIGRDAEQAPRPDPRPLPTPPNPTMSGPGEGA